MSASAIMPGGSGAAERSRVTFRQDRIRGACQGIFETGALTFGLVVCIRYFDAPLAVKATQSSAHSIGLILTPLSLFFFARRGWTAAQSAARNFLVAAFMIVVAALAPNLAVFVAALGLGSMLLAQQAPLLVHIYTSNYAASQRGRMLSNSIVLSLVTAILFSVAGGRLLDWNLATFRWLFCLMAAAAAVAAWAVWRMPAEPFSRDRGNNPLSALRFAREDPVFGWMLFIWMLMGFGNLMVLPLRIEYMANPRFGIDATNAQIAVMTLVIPSVVRLATTHFWGIFFDRYNFFIIRSVLNGFVVAAILLFFASKSLWVIGVASGLFGVSFAGGNIAWNLWVTKFAPPDRASDYMSVHTFLTGVRGVLAPFVGFWMIARFSALTTAFVGAGLVALSMVLLDPMRRKHGDLKPASERTES